MLAWFAALDLGQFVAVLTLANVGMYLASWALVRWAQRLFPSRALNAGRPTVTRTEVLLSFAVVLINIGVGLPGWLLWKSGRIVLVDGSPLGTLVDLAICLLSFDLCMYLLHRLMHVRLALFTRLHGIHHGQVNLSGLSFYIMNPLEALGFGALLLAFLMLRPFSIEALLAFLFINWAYGTMGHSGLRYRTRFWRWVAGDSRFHQLHHETRRGNYGFFTPLWDRLFGTVVLDGTHTPDE